MLTVAAPDAGGRTERVKEYLQHKKEISDLDSEIRKLKLRKILKEDSNSEFVGDITFDEVMRVKKNRNLRDPPLSFLGPQKISLLRSYGIDTAQQLLDWDVGEELARQRNAKERSKWEGKLRRWKAIAEADLNKEKEEYDSCCTLLSATEENQVLKAVANELTLEEMMAEERATLPGSVAVRNRRREAPTVIPVFGEKKNVSGYNDRLIPKRAVDSIVITEFKHRK